MNIKKGNISHKARFSFFPYKFPNALERVGLNLTCGSRGQECGEPWDQ